MAVTFQIIITGLLHPQEIYALPVGIVYYVTIPCMYMLLTIYSVLNMNDVSWGTRENPQDAGPKKVGLDLDFSQVQVKSDLNQIKI